MKRNFRKSLINLNSKPFVLNGLRSTSISEPAIPIFLNGKAAGDFQGIEVYENVSGHPNYPQTIADIISNTYLRLTYQKPSGVSATFGTSIVGSISYKPRDSTLNLIPSTQMAEIRTDKKDRLAISISADFGDNAKLMSLRTYSQNAKLGLTAMRLAIHFDALKDINLDRLRLGNDCFRLVTISSMFSSDNLFDGNIIMYKSEGELKAFNLSYLKGRDRYIFERPQSTTEFELLKGIGSIGRVYTPGSPDSPSINIKVIQSTIPTDELGLQGYLTDSRDVKDDSLSVWLEWIKCPEMIQKGKKIEIELEVSAFPPKIDL